MVLLLALDGVAGFGSLFQYGSREVFDGCGLEIRDESMAIDYRCYGWQDTFLKKGQQVKPFERCSLEAPVVKVVAIYVDACPKQFVPSNEKTDFRRLFPPHFRWTSHTAIAD